MEIFRTFEYNGKMLQLSKVEPEPGSQSPSVLPVVNAPGAGNIEIGAITLSAEKIAPGEALTLSAQVKGRQIAFVFTEILLHDPALGQAYGPVMRDYTQAEQNKEIGGVLHPKWEEDFHLTLTITPSLHLVTDGIDSAFGFLIPAAYGLAECWLDGLYTSLDEATRRRVRITFDGAGKTKSLVAFQESGGRSAPHALTLSQGDQFSPFVQVLHSPVDENHAWQEVQGFSTPLTYRGQPLRWVKEPPLPGDYLVGLLIQDMDGGLTRKYAPLAIRA
ncbi:MAG: hypothetical protein AB9891_11530 [Anaerolineaceae bacterium]